MTAAALTAALGPTSDSLVWRKLRMGFVEPDAIAGLRVDGLDPSTRATLAGATLTVATSDGDRDTTCLGLVDDVVVVELASGSLPRIADLSAARPGDEVRVDDRRHLAFTRGAAARLGAAVEPSPMHQTGRFHGRMIHVNGLHDFLALPGRVMEFAQRVRDVDPAAYDQRYRLWFLDNASHYPPELMPPGPTPVVDTRHVATDGAIERALVELIAWVEDDVEPTPGLPGDRLDDVDPATDDTVAVSFQPTVTLTATGTGDELCLHAHAEVPDRSSTILGIDWDLDGTGNWIDGEITQVGADHGVAPPPGVSPAPGTHRVTARVRSRMHAAAHGRAMPGRQPGTSDGPVDVPAPQIRLNT